MALYNNHILYVYIYISLYQIISSIYIYVIHLHLEHRTPRLKAFRVSQGRGLIAVAPDLDQRGASNGRPVGVLPGDCVIKCDVMLSGTGMILYNIIKLYDIYIYTKNNKKYVELHSIYMFIYLIIFGVFYCSRATSIGWEWEDFADPT